MTLYTQRLLLRQWQEKDIEPFALMNSDPRVMKYFPSTLSRSQSDRMLERCQQLIAEKGWGFWAVEHQTSGQFIGLVGLHQLVDEFPFSPCVEVGWRLAPQHWGKGYATEAAQASLDYAFTELQLAEAVSFTVHNNMASRSVMERLSMVNTENNFHHPKIPLSSPLSEHVLYKIMNSEHC